jgi:hypothetical protein
MEYITEETIKKIQETIKKEQESTNNEIYFCSEILEEEIINEMLDIIRNDEKFQEFSKQTMRKIILGE